MRPDVETILSKDERVIYINYIEAYNIILDVSKNPAGDVLLSRYFLCTCEISIVYKLSASQEDIIDRNTSAVLMYLE